MSYGPDRSLPLTDGRYHHLTLPENKKVIISFDSIAANENALVIYTYPHFDYFAEKGNFGRSLDPITIEKTAKNRDFYVTGWHKNTPPNGRERWWASPMKVTQVNPYYLIVGFMDENPGDYNNMSASVRIYD